MVSPDMSVPEPLGAANDAADTLDRLDRLRRIDALIANLRSHGLKISPGGEIRASGLVIRLARAGISIENGNDAALWLTPLLSTGQSDQHRCRQCILEWWDERDPQTEAAASVREASASAAGQVRADAGRRRIIVRLILSLLALALAGAFFYAAWLWVQSAPPTPGGAQTGPSPEPGVEDTPSPSDLGAIEIYARIFTTYLVPGLVLFLPFGAAIWALFTVARHGRGTLRRDVGSGALFQTVPIPAVHSDLFAGPDANLATRMLKKSTWREGQSLDIVTSIRETIRAGGLSQVHRVRRRLIHEYVLICERSGAQDHIVLLADALTTRFVEEDVAFVRFDAHGHFRHLRHVAGRMHGTPVESLAEIAARHAGARLIVLGTGDAFFRPQDDVLSDAPGFARSGREQRIFGAFQSPVLLSTTPPTRWGDRERLIFEEGVAIFPASTIGLTAAASWFIADSEDSDEAETTNAIPPGDDQLLALLRRDRTRLASDMAPDASECAHIAGSLQAFMGNRADFRILAAIFAFPRITLALTRFIAHRIENRIVDEDLAGKLARLPWLRDGRTPDWLRVAVWQALNSEDRAQVADGLRGIVRELGLGERDAQGSEDHDGAIDILADPDLRHLALARIGVGPELVTGESLFLRFLGGADLEDVDRPLSDIKAPLAWPRIVAAGVLGLVGLAATFLGVPMIGGFGDSLENFANPLFAGFDRVQWYRVFGLLSFAYWLLVLNSLQPPLNGADAPIAWWSFVTRWWSRSREEDRIVSRVRDLQDYLRNQGRSQGENGDAARRTDEFQAAIQTMNTSLRDLSSLRAKRRRDEAAARRLQPYLRFLSALEWPFHAVVLIVIWVASRDLRFTDYTNLLIAFLAAFVLGLRLLRWVGLGPAIITANSNGVLAPVSDRIRRLGGVLLPTPFVVILYAGLLHANALALPAFAEKSSGLTQFLIYLPQFAVTAGLVGVATFAALTQLGGHAWGDPINAARQLGAAFLLHLVAGCSWALVISLAFLAFGGAPLRLGSFGNLIGTVLPALLLIGPIWLTARQLPGFAPALNVLFGPLIVVAVVFIGLKAGGLDPEPLGRWFMPGYQGAFTAWPTLCLVTGFFVIFGAGATSRFLTVNKGSNDDPDPTAGISPRGFGATRKLDSAIRQETLLTLKRLFDTAWIIPPLFLIIVMVSATAGLGLPYTLVGIVLAVVAVRRWGRQATAPLLVLMAVHIAGFSFGGLRLHSNLVLALFLAAIMRYAPDPIAAIALARHTKIKPTDYLFVVSATVFAVSLSLLPPLDLAYAGGNDYVLALLFFLFALQGRGTRLLALLIPIALLGTLVPNLASFERDILRNEIVQVYMPTGIALLGSWATLTYMKALIGKQFSLQNLKQSDTDSVNSPFSIVRMLAILACTILVFVHIWFGFDNPLGLLGLNGAYDSQISVLFRSTYITFLAFAIGFSAYFWTNPAARLLPLMTVLVVCVLGAAMIPAVLSWLASLLTTSAQGTSTAFDLSFGPFLIRFSAEIMDLPNAWTVLFMKALFGLLCGAAVAGILTGIGPLLGIARITAQPFREIMLRIRTQNGLRSQAETKAEPEAVRLDLANDSSALAFWPNAFLDKLREAEDEIEKTDRPLFESLIGIRLVRVVLVGFICVVLVIAATEIAIRTDGLVQPLSAF